ncbi:MAG: invasin domain 3-containing protein, partial [Providencia heimbachae]|nr:invasin domain 3-containing protein [Providencia heimbachae]
SKEVTFIADEGTATITDANLTVVTNNQLANGVAKNQLKAVVTDAKGNLVPNVDVVFTSDNGGQPATQTVKTNENGEALFDVTNTQAGVTTVKASINGTDVSKGVTFEPGIPDLSKGILTINKQRVIANKTDKAEITLSVVDSNGNGVPNLANITFVVENSQGNVVTNGITISDIKSGSSTGTYEAEISGDNVGSYTVKAQLNGDYFNNSSVGLSLYSFSFKMTPDKATIVLNGTYQFIINAIPSDYPSDTTKYEEVSSGVNWSSSETGVASITSTGLITGKSVGVSSIVSSGSYQGFNFANLVSLLGVQGQILSTPSGDIQPTDKSGTLIIEPPNYSLLMNCGSIVDGIGSSESNFFGGKGGNRIVVSNLNQVSSVKIGVGQYRGPANTQERDIRQLTQLIFTMKDGSIAECGNNQNSSNIEFDTFVVPDGQVLEGVTVSGGQFLHSIQFITKLMEL